MGNDQQAHLRAGQRIDTVGHNTQCINVQSGVSLIQDGDLRLQHGHLQNLRPFLLATGEALVQVAAGEGFVDLQQLHLLIQQLAELRNWQAGSAASIRFAALSCGVNGPAQEVPHAQTRDGDRILKCQEQTQSSSLVGRQL